MNREVFKSILLSVLVLASIAMTWNIWFYKADFKNYKGPSNSTNSVAIAESRKLSDVIRPSLILQKSPEGTVGQIDSNQVMSGYKIFQNAVFTNVQLESAQKSPARKRGTSSYEIMFPAPLMQETLKEIFHFGDNNVQIPQNVLIDRIEIYQPTSGHGLVAAFRSQNNVDQLSAAVSGTNLNSLSKIFLNGQTGPYGLQQLKGKTLYLPLGNTNVRSEMIYFEKIPVDEFIPILFTDPKNVFQYRGKTAYTDGTSQLENNSNILQYVDPGISGSTVMTDPIFHSFEFINNFKAWTDDFMYDGLILSSNQQETVTFRLLLGSYMVYNTEYYPNPFLTTMELTWKSQDLSSFNRTLVTFTRIDEPGSVTLNSGSDVLSMLKKNGVAVNEIEDMAIGYGVDNPQSNDNSSLKATPDWFYKINNRWYSENGTLASRQPGQLGVDSQ
ncbi:YycH family regulatory protein [Sporolactobacillus pectinivorans]|uniref:YycH family regulatory protein n=1 Tax=Sporolactobacillus pectinivorans TaxID=1591408 RepID=UPI000C269C9C|nr:two-component system activity regulator YycH [Sporolactobacillus pectinivorans]